MAAAAIKGINARIRSNPTSNYLCSTHFWGPASNFGIPIAAILDTQKDPELISGRMTAALTVYAATFMRYALAVQPRNYLLFACHFVNLGAQSVQGYRYMKYWNYGGREQQEKLKAVVSGAVKDVEGEGRKLVGEAEREGKKVLEKGREIKDRVVK